VAVGGEDLLGVALHDSGLALRGVIERVHRLDDEAVRAPSNLPGWSRGHVLAHLHGVGSAFARQAEHAARGERVVVYDGGQAGRDAAIESGAKRSAAEHADALESLAGRLARAWPEPASRVWDAPVTYRDGPLSGVALAWWREARIHVVDLAVGVGPDSWVLRLCEHLWEFLEPRLAAAGPVELVADDAGLRRTVSPGAVEDRVTVTGSLRDLTAWLAGREPGTAPVAARGGSTVPLPELGPWPSRR
jgi:maleylpyruvate isomerase